MKLHPRTGPMDKYDDPRGVWRVACHCGWRGRRQLRNMTKPCPRQYGPGEHRIIGGFYLRAPKGV